MEPEGYFDADKDRFISSEELKEADRETQISVMRSWFYKNFENPAERTPYESREGGYQWIWGGPYEADEELNSEFYGLVPEDVIEELIDELNGESAEWGPAEKPEDYDDYLFSVIAQQTEASSKFSSAIIDIKQLLDVSVPTLVQGTFHRLLYVNVISALETYLSDTFISAVANDEALMRKYVESSPEFRGKKVSLSEVYRAREAIESEVKSTLVDIVWHNLGKVKPMYADTLAVSFPDDMGDVNRAIVIRHDVVHRNGKTKDGKEVVITEAVVRNLIRATEVMIRDIDAQLPAKSVDALLGANAEDF